MGTVISVYWMIICGSPLTWQLILHPAVAWNSLRNMQRILPSVLPPPEVPVAATPPAAPVPPAVPPPPPPLVLVAVASLVWECISTVAITAFLNLAAPRSPNLSGFRLKVLVHRSVQWPHQYGHKIPDSFLVYFKLSPAKVLIDITYIFGSFIKALSVY